MSEKDKEIVFCMHQEPELGFRLLLSKYKEKVYWHIRRLVISHPDAQDATQETFIRIFRSFHQFRTDASLPAWIYKIATNEALRIMSKHKDCLSPLESSDTYIDLMADEYTDYSDLEEVRLQKAILSLPTKQQLAFNLRYYDELDYEEIAEITTSTPAGVKANYYLAKQKIIQYINTHD